LARKQRTQPTLKDNTDSVPIEDLLSEAQEAADRAVPENTLRAYKADWQDFARWCKRRQLSALPAKPSTLGAYLVARARTHKMSSLRRRLTVIGKVHKIRGEPNPGSDQGVRNTWRGLLRSKGEAQTRKAPLLIDDLRRMMQVLPESLSGIRDRAIILLGFSGAMRRSEVVALNVGDLELAKEGLVIWIRRSKTDQTMKGRKIGVPYGEREPTCPVRAVLRWIESSRIADGPLFRKVNRFGRVEGTQLSGYALAVIVKAAFKKIGRNPRRFGGHSLRSGLATSAAMAGVEERAIQDQTGHKSLKALRAYIRDGNLFRNNAAGKIGL
jgi:integrase